MAHAAARGTVMWHIQLVRGTVTWHVQVRGHGEVLCNCEAQGDGGRPTLRQMSGKKNSRNGRRQGGVVGNG
jgi:hypothetical protein